MCLYPRMFRNKKYTATAKNGGNVPPLKDERTIYVPIGCGKCIECKKQKAREWQIRLMEDVKTNRNGKFITLTMSDQSYAKLSEEIDATGYELDNQIATKAIRLFLERYRKRFKKSLRHWLVTELGHNGTQNIHLHGIIWTDVNLNTVEKLWSYGMMWKGKRIGTDEKGQPILQNYVNEQTVNYIVKYMTKTDEIHKTYTPRVLTSAGIGANYTKTIDFKRNTYKAEQTNETYKTRTGHKIALPIYWRNKAYTDEQKENLWLQRLDKEQRWVMGEKIDVSTERGIQTYKNLVQYYRATNLRMGYGGHQKDEEREEYERQRRKIIQATRIAKGRAKASKAKTKDIKAGKAIW